MNETVGTAIIGAGQAGLATGYHLARRGQPFVILEESATVGDVWRERYESLRLFTPARADGLPGMRFPAPASSFPTRDQMADFLAAYTVRMDLPVRTGIAVDRVETSGDGYVVSAGDLRLEAERVVVAAGGHRRPKVPDLATEIDPGVVQLHSVDYRRPDQLQDGPVLVVGASHSGADLALEAVAAGHATFLSGHIHGELPLDLEGRLGRALAHVLPFAARHVLTLRTPIGRRMAPFVRAGGAPLLRVKSADLARAGVEHVAARTVATRDGRPVLDDGRVLDVRNILWCTGFHEDFRWVEPAELGADGYPMQWRGVTAAPGLYFVGLPFQYSFASAMIHGVGRDAAFVARRIADRQIADRQRGSGGPTELARGRDHRRYGARPDRRSAAVAAVGAVGAVGAEAAAGAVEGAGDRDE